MSHASCSLWVERKLAPFTVLVTRPAQAGERLCQYIDQQGGKAIFFPTILFGPSPDFKALMQAICSIDQYDWVIFPSPQAVRAVLLLLREKWPILPRRTKLAAVGRGTAQLLKKAGYIVTACPAAPFNSQSLLSLPMLQNVINCHVMLIQGSNGLNIIANTLTQRGAILSSVIAYERKLPTINCEHYFELFCDQKIDVVISTSCTNIKNLQILLHTEDWDRLKQLPMIVVSHRIEIFARHLGFNRLWLAQGADYDALLECLFLNQRTLFSARLETI